MSESIKAATPVENQIPANSEAIAVTLADGTEISSERAVRWLDTEKQEYVYQVEFDGKQYLGERGEDGKIHLQ